MTLNEIILNSEASQNKDELKPLILTILTINPKVILEIGTDRGFSAKLWSECFTPDVLISVDKEAKDLPKITNFTFVHRNSHDMETIDKVRDALHGKGVDFLFIDGDHEADGVGADYLYYAPLVRKGGVIAFHDICIRNNDTVEVYRFWDEIRKFNNYQEISFKGGTGVGILFV